MKQIVLFWRDPMGNLAKETLDPEKSKLHMDGPFLKINDKESGGITRIIPEHKLEMVEFIEVQEESRILKPTIVPPADVPKQFGTP